MDFIIAAANLHAFNYGLKGESNPEYFKKVLDGVFLPEFKPKSGVQVQVKDDEPVANDKDSAPAGDGGDLASLAAALPQPSSLAGYRLMPAKFEKDDDTNHHMDFITAACALLHTSPPFRKEERRVAVLRQDGGADVPRPLAPSLPQPTFAQ